MDGKCAAAVEQHNAAYEVRATQRVILRSLRFVLSFL